MSAEDALRELGEDRTTHPVDALESADAHRDAVAPRLRQVLEQCVTDPDGESSTTACCYRWFVGLSMDDELWDATTFTRNRDRLLESDIADGFFAEVLAARLL